MKFDVGSHYAVEIYMMHEGSLRYKFIRKSNAPMMMSTVFHYLDWSVSRKLTGTDFEFRQGIFTDVDILEKFQRTKQSQVLEKEVPMLGVKFTLNAIQSQEFWDRIGLNIDAVIEAFQ